MRREERREERERKEGRGRQEARDLRVRGKKDVNDDKAREGVGVVTK